MTGAGSSRVLVTGAGGMLGRSLVRALTPSFRVIAPGRGELDLLRPGEVTAKIAGLAPEVIIHAAAYTAVDRAELEPATALAVNGAGTQAVVEGAARCGAYLVYVSTDYVFDGAKQAPYDEDDEPKPLNVYGRSKLQGERAARSLDRHLIVRTAWTFGPGGHSFVSGMAARAQEGSAVSVVDDQVGSPTYTPHLAAAMGRLVDKEARGVVNVVNEGSSSWYELARETYRLVGASPELVNPTVTERLDRPARRPPFSVLATERLGRLLGETLPNWREALAEFLGRQAEA